MTSPVEALLSNVNWVESDSTPSDDGLPYATHSGVLQMAGATLRCYRLSNGEVVFDADDGFFGGIL